MSLRSLSLTLLFTAVAWVSTAVPANAGWPSQTGEVWLPPRRGLFGDPYRENNAFHPSARILYKWNNPHHKHGHPYGNAHGHGHAYAPGQAGAYGHSAGCQCGYCNGDAGTAGYGRVGQGYGGHGYGGYGHGRLDYAPYRYQPDPMVYGVYVP